MHEQARVDRRRWFDARKDCPDQALGYRVQQATNRRGKKAQVTVYAIKDDIKPFILPQLSIFNSVVQASASSTPKLRQPLAQQLVALARCGVFKPFGNQLGLLGLDQIKLNLVQGIVPL